MLSNCVVTRVATRRFEVTLRLDKDWVIPGGALQMRAVCSSGPGGQNVNKVSTKVQLRFSLDTPGVLSRDQQQRFREHFPGHVTTLGEALIVCDETRSLETNKEYALARLKAMILSIRRAPRRRVKTRPSRAQRARRLNDKKARSELKKSRSRTRDD